MKSLILTLAIFTVCSSAFSGVNPKHDYQCILQDLHMYNGSVFYNVTTPEQIDEILSSTSGDGYRWKVVEVTKTCDEARLPHSGEIDYACVARRLEGYNGGVYIDMTKEKIDELLRGNSALRWKVVQLIEEDCPSL